MDDLTWKVERRTDGPEAVFVDRATTEGEIMVYPTLDHLISAHNAGDLEEHPGDREFYSAHEWRSVPLEELIAEGLEG